MLNLSNFFNDEKRRGYLLLALIFILSAAMLFPGLGSFGLHDPWEMNISHIAKRMAETPKIIVAEEGNEVSSEIEKNFSGRFQITKPAVDASKENRNLIIDRTKSLLSENVYNLLIINLDSVCGADSDTPGYDYLASVFQEITGRNPLMNIVFYSGNQGIDRQNVINAINRAVSEKAKASDLKSQPEGIGDDFSIPEDIPLIKGLTGGSLKNEIESIEGKETFTAQFKRKGQTYFIPVLHPLLVSISYRVFGFSEFASRLPAVLAAVGTLILFSFFTLRLFGLNISLISSIILLTSPMFIFSARYVSDGMLFTFLFTLTSFSMLILFNEGFSWKYFLLMICGAVFTFFTAGLMGLLLICALQVSYIILGREYKKQTLIPASATLFLFGLFLCLTFIPDAPTWMDHFKFMTKTFEGGLNKDRSGFEFFIKEIGFGFFPWIMLLPMCIAYIFFNIEKRSSLFISLFMLVPLVVLMVALRDFKHYFYPALPAFALAAAIYLEQRDESSMERFAGFIGFGIFAVILKDLVMSPEPLVSFLTTDPAFSATGTENQFPENLQLSGFVKFIIILMGLAFLFCTTKIPEYLVKLISVLREKKAFIIGIFAVVILIIIDALITMGVKYTFIFYPVKDEKVLSISEVLQRIFLFSPDIIFFYLVIIYLILNRYRTPVIKLKNLFRLPGIISKLHSLQLAKKMAEHGFYITASLMLSAILAQRLANGFIPELSFHVSQKHIIDSYRQSSSLQKGELFKHGTFAGSGQEETNFYTGMIPEISSRTEMANLLLDAAKRTFFILPKNTFSEINGFFREKSNGAHIPVLDSRSSRFLLAVSRLSPEEKDENWIKTATITKDQFASLTDVKKENVNFDNVIKLVGYSIEGDNAKRGKIATLKMYFECLDKVTAGYRIFMHIDRKGSANRIHGDHWPLNLARETEDSKTCVGCYATNHWRKGDIIVDTYLLDIPIGSPSGPHEMWIGFYNPNNDKRLKVIDFDKALIQHDGQNRVNIGTLLVE